MREGEDPSTFLIDRKTFRSYHFVNEHHIKWLGPHISLNKKMGVKMMKNQK